MQPYKRQPSITEKMTTQSMTICRLPAFTVEKSMVMKCSGSKMVQGDKEFLVKLGEHGIMNGWAYWPIEYDPVWVKECSGYEAT